MLSLDIHFRSAHPGGEIDWKKRDVGREEDEEIELQRK